MRVPINLAREPFRRDRPVLAASAAAVALLVASLVVLISLALNERHAAQDTRAMLTQVNRQLADVGREQVKFETQMRQPGNEVVLDRSILLNTLIKRKAISWTRIFSDLETVLPPNVRVIAIRPQVNAQDQLFLDMTVSAPARASDRLYRETGRLRRLRHPPPSAASLRLPKPTPLTATVFR